MDKRPILIIEDDIPFAKMLDQGLGRNGLKVHLADTAKEAWNLIEKVTPE
ncbi:MAG: sigma-54-dependent Fis family transcriptional regulator, partial [Deltaproteobacteria bacterium]